jgi:demethylmenaquinone methyltransferase/2-methoxy-6-polyprenyl-1,4-benzoquinol methylase
MSEWNKKRKVKRRYDLTAHIYDMRYAEEQTSKIKAALSAVKIGRGDMILDVGCGTGILFNHVAEKTKETVGLDISKRTLLEAKKRGKKFQNVHLVLADADNMPLKGKTFNHVFGMTLLQNMPSPAAALDEIVRVATENAVIIITALKKAFTLDRFERLLQNAGLKVLSQKSEGLQCYVAVCALHP